MHPDIPHPREEFEHVFIESKAILAAARTRWEEGDFVGPLREYEALLRTHARLLQSLPSELHPRVRDHMAAANSGMGICLQGQGDSEAAIEQFELSESTRSTLAREGYTSPGFGSNRAKNLQTLAELFRRQGAEYRAAAVSALRRACNIFGRELMAGRITQGFLRDYARAVCEYADLQIESAPSDARELLRLFRIQCEASPLSLDAPELVTKLWKREQELNICCDPSSVPARSQRWMPTPVENWAFAGVMCTAIWYVIPQLNHSWAFALLTLVLIVGGFGFLCGIGGGRQTFREVYRDASVKSTGLISTAPRTAALSAAHARARSTSTTNSAPGATHHVRASSSRRCCYGTR